tara:strand:- start:744 stop:1124 length:381 start_codon:yes stop_codon:yes gene_type:complete
MLSKEDLQGYSVKKGDVYNVDKLIQTSGGMTVQQSNIGVIAEVSPWKVTYDSIDYKEAGYLEYTQSYTILVNARLLPCEQVIFYNRRQWLEDGDADFEHRTSSIESDRLALYEAYGPCIFRLRRQW